MHTKASNKYFMKNIQRNYVKRVPLNLQNHACSLALILSAKIIKNLTKNKIQKNYQIYIELLSLSISAQFLFKFYSLKYAAALLVSLTNKEA